MAMVIHRRRAALLLAAAAAAGVFAVAVVLSRGGADGRSGAEVPSGDDSPATQPAESYPPAELVQACEAAAKRLRERLDETFNVAVLPPFVVAGDCTRGRLDGYVKWSVVRPAEAMWASYFDEKPAGVITVLLFADGRSYRHWAKQLFGDTVLPHFGYCRSDGTLVMDISTGTGTLVHELTHSLIKYDFPAVPDWFNEGLASLHEQCSVGEDRIVGHVNWRLPELQKAVKAGKLRPLRELVTARDFYGPLKGLNYAQARYFAMYMQEQGVLGEFYKTFRDMHAEGEEPNSDDRAANESSNTDDQQTGESQSEVLNPPVLSPGAPGSKGNSQFPDVQAVEQILGRKIEDVDADLRKWVMTLRAR